MRNRAMTEFLSTHPSAYYCSDVFLEEPYEGDMAKLPNTLLLPHIGASTLESRREMEAEAIQNYLQVLRGDPCRNIVTKNL